MQTQNQNIIIKNLNQKYKSVISTFSMSEIFTKQELQQKDFIYIQPSIPIPSKLYTILLKEFEEQYTQLSATDILNGFCTFLFSIGFHAELVDQFNTLTQINEQRIN